MTQENNYDIKSLTTPAATGGTVTTVSNYRIHTFTSSGTFTPIKTMNVEVLVVAGGGGGSIGGWGGGGGGGAGGLVYHPTKSVTLTVYTVTIGNGGASTTNGSDSVFGDITAKGGGGGTGQNVGKDGGSGAGGSTNGPYPTAASNIGGSGLQTNSGGGTGYGFNGGTSMLGTSSGGGGGGGAGTAGANATSSAGGNGGEGRSYDISGTSQYYAAGGGAGTGVGYTKGIGGSGIGGSGTTGTGSNAVNNTGSGGGGGSDSSVAGGTGGSGIVIIRYSSSEDVTATAMTILPSENPCRTGICIIDVSVTWTNNNPTSTSSFAPAITASTGTVSTQASRNLAAGASVTLPFTVSGMTAGTCSICPNPN